LILSKLKKILFVSHDANRAGAQLFLLSVMKHFKAKGYEVILLIINDWGNLKGELESQFEVYFLNQTAKPKKKSFFGSKKTALEIIQNKHQIDLIYLNTIASVELLPRLNSLFSAPIISHIHELQYSIAQYGPTNSMELLFNFSTKIIACSQAVADNLSLYKASDQLRVVHSFVENDQILDICKKSDKAAIRTKYELTNDKIWICACGNADWRKAPDIFLQIAAATLKNSDKYGFLWIGIPNEGEHFDQLTYDANKFGVSAAIKWISPTTEAVEIINASDVFLVSSREDPFPLVVLEAALSEKPIFGFKNTGGADEFIDETCGYKADYLDVAQMSGEIIKLDTEKITKLGINAKNKVLNNYGFNISIKKIETTINEIIEKC
jgi:glycosyltransferase involved in cell wall biosynthesis